MASTTSDECKLACHHSTSEIIAVVVCDVMIAQWSGIDDGTLILRLENDQKKPYLFLCLSENHGYASSLPASSFNKHLKISDMEAPIKEFRRLFILTNEVCQFFRSIHCVFGTSHASSLSSN